MDKYKKTRHHIIPRSRGGRGLEDNISWIPYVEHNNYHQLFGNRTPEEIGRYLQDYFWANKYEVKVVRNGENCDRTKYYYETGKK